MSISIRCPTGKYAGKAGHLIHERLAAFFLDLEMAHPPLLAMRAMASPVAEG
jgi:hypothetical protein